MRVRPILFSAPMVRAILAGTKSQTRRVVKRGTPDDWNACPYGSIGDRLWVRETWAYGVHAMAATRAEDGPFVYAADGTTQGRLCDRWRPSIHMPRAASRITLEIAEVRAERLQDISEADAIAEGIERMHIDSMNRQQWRVYPHTDGDPREEVVTYCGKPYTSNPIESYKSLWLSLNGPGSWDANPFVWVLTFRPIG